MKSSDRTAEILRRRRESRIELSASRAIRALRPILARLPCRSVLSVEGSYAFLPTTDEMSEARGALFDLAQAIDKQ